jgi:hypothetical protein
MLHAIVKCAEKKHLYHQNFDIEIYFEPFEYPVPLIRSITFLRWPFPRLPVRVSMFFFRSADVQVSLGRAVREARAFFFSLMFTSSTVN